MQAPLLAGIKKPRRMPGLVVVFLGVLGGSPAVIHGLVELHSIDAEAWCELIVAWRQSIRRALDDPAHVEADSIISGITVAPVRAPRCDVRHALEGVTQRNSYGFSAIAISGVYVNLDRVAVYVGPVGDVVVRAAADYLPNGVGHRRVLWRFAELKHPRDRISAQRAVAAAQ